MKENGINIWLKNVANILGNKKIIFLKVNQNDIQEIINDLKPLTMYYISIIKIEDLKENKHVLKGMHHIIISNSSENIENMKLLINREIIYIEDMNSIQKLISLLTNKSLDHNNEIKYELLQKVDFESLLKENQLNVERFVLNRLLLLQKISCNFEYMDKEFLVICLKNYYGHNKLLFASFAQLLYRLATLDFISSSKKNGAKMYGLLGVRSKVVNSKKLDLPMNQISKNFRVYDLNEKPFVTETKLEIAQKLVKLNIKELDLTKISKITDLPLKIIEKLYKTINLK